MSDDFFSIVNSDTGLPTNFDSFNSYIPTNSIDSKATSVEQAKKEKLTSLSQKTVKPFMSDEAAQSFLGGAVNTTGGVAKTAVDMFGWATGIPKTITDFGLSFNNGVRTSEITGETLSPTEFAKTISSFPNELAKTGKSLQSIVEPIYNPIVQEQLQQKFAEAYDKNDGFTSVAQAFADVVATNPIEGAQTFITQLPYMASLASKGVVGAGAFLSTVSNNNNESLAKFRESYGREPTSEEASIMLGTSIASSAVEKVESMFLLNKLKLPSIGSKVIEAPVKAVTGGITEFAQEGSQNILTDIGGYQGKLLDNPELQAQVQREAAIAGGIGASSGSTGGFGMKLIAPKNPEIAQGKVLERSTKAIEVFKQSGAYKDIGESTTSPAEAIRTFQKTPTQESYTEAIKAVLNTPHINSNLIAGGLLKAKEEFVNTLTPEVKDVLTQLSTNPETISSKLVGKVNAGVNSVAKAVNEGVASVKVKAITEENIQKNPLASMRLLKDTTKFTSTNLDELKVETDKLKKAYLSISDSAETLKLPQKERDEIDNLFEELVNYRNAYKSKLLPSVDVVKTLIESNPDPIKLGSSKQAFFERLSLTKPNEFTEEQLNAVSKSTALSKEEKATVEAFKAFRKTTSEVSENILNKSEKGFKSIVGYMKGIEASISSNRKDSASKELTALNNFYNKFTVKRQNAEEALAKFNKTGKEVTFPEIDPSKSLFISPKLEAQGRALVQSIIDEHKAIETALQLAKAKFSNAFNVPLEPSKTASEAVKSVEVTPSTPEANKAAVEAPKASIKQGSIVSSGKNVYVVYKVTGDTLYTRELSSGAKTFNPNKANVTYVREANIVTDSNGTYYFDPVTNIVVSKKGIPSDRIVEAVKGIYSNIEEGKYKVVSKEVSKNLLESSSTKTKDGIALVDKAFEELPTISFGKTVFTENLDIEELLNKSNLTDLTEDFTKLRDQVNSSIKGDTLANDGTLIQDITQNPLVALMRPDSTSTLILQPAVSQAIAVGALQYAGTRSGELLFNDAMAIRGMLGYDSRDDLPRDAYNLLMYAGANINTLADAIGNDIYTLLDLSISDEVFKNKLIHALGFTAIKALLDVGYVKQNKVSLEEYKSLRKNTEEAASDLEENAGIGTDEDTSFNTEAGTVTFIGLDTKIVDGRIEVDDEGKIILPPNVQEVKELFSNEGTNKGIFKKIFNASPDIVDPKLNPSKSIPKYLKNTFQTLNETAKDVIKTLNNRPFKLNKELFDKFKEAYDNEDTHRPLMESLGYVYNLDEIQASKREAVQAINLSIQRDIDHLLEYINLLPEKGNEDVYFNFELWVNGRIAVKSDSGINPLYSKFIRHLFPLKEFTESIDLTNTDSVNRLMQAIAQGLDKDIDTVSIPETYKQIEIIRDTSEYKNFKKDPNNPKYVVDVMTKFGLGIHSIEAMTNLVKYDNAIAKGKESVVITGSVEWDGKTNGVAIATLQSPDLGSTVDITGVLHALGFFTKEAEGENYSQVMSGSLDMYQKVVVAWDKQLNNIKDVKTKGIQQKYIGDLVNKDGKITREARKLAKYPFMTTIFGKSASTVASDFGNVLLELIYNKLEKPNLTKEQIKEINDDIRSLTGLKSEIPTEEYIDYLFPLNIERAIIDSVTNTYGDALSKGINSLFGTFFNYRNDINNQINAIGRLFITKVLKAKGDRVLTKQLLKELMEGPLKGYVPNFNTANSANPTEGLVVLKSGKVRTNTSVQVTYTQVDPIQNTLVTNGVLKALPDTFSHKGGIQEIVLTDAGVGALIGLIHSIDSAVAQRFLKEYVSFGVHDGFHVPISKATEAGKALNSTFLQVNREYSIANSVSERTREVSKLDNNPSLIKQEFVDARSNVEVNRRNLLKNTITSMSQFAGDGLTAPNPSYKPTGASKAKTDTQTSTEAQEAAVDPIEASEGDIDEEINSLVEEVMGTIETVEENFDLTAKDKFKYLKQFIFNKKLKPEEQDKLIKALKCRSSK